MSALFCHDHTLVCHPIHLHRSAGSFEGLMSMPGMICPAENKQCAPIRRDLINIVFQICGAAEDT